MKYNINIFSNLLAALPEAPLPPPRAVLCQMPQIATATRQQQWLHLRRMQRSLRRR